MTRRFVSLAIALLLTTAGWLSAPAAGCATHKTSQQPAWSDCCCDHTMPDGSSCVMACQEQAPLSLAALKSSSPQPETPRANLMALSDTTGAFEANPHHVRSTRPAASPPAVRISKRYLLDCTFRL